MSSLKKYTVIGLTVFVFFIAAVPVFSGVVKYAYDDNNRLSSAVVSVAMGTVFYYDTVGNREFSVPFFRSIGTFGPDGYWYLDTNGNGVLEEGTDTTFKFGKALDLPVADDWGGDGISTIGVFREGTWILDMNGNGVWDTGVDAVYTYGGSADRPVTGAW